MKNIDIEKIDTVKARANVSYKEAKEVLEKFNGDIIASILYLEEQNKTLPSNNHQVTYFDKLKDLMINIRVTRIIVQNKNIKSIDISATFGIFICVLAPHLVLLSFPFSYLKGYRIRFENVEDLRVDLTKR
ncbi:MAG: DUF4342 domain-containing protein [Peptostreptococcaceae bacterium]